jgi:hypothetical protein
MKTNWFTVVVTCVLASVGTAYSQESAEHQREAEAIVEVTNILYSIDSLKQWPAGQKTPDQWMEDNSEGLRLLMSHCLADYAETTNCSTGMRKEIVELLARRLNDSSGRMRERVTSELLVKFREDDFNEEAKRLIKERFDASGHKALVLLTGLVDPDYCYQRIKHRLVLPVADVRHEDEKPEISEQRWQDMQVAARWGDRAWTLHLIEAVESEKDSERRLFILFRRLIYVPQPEVIEYLQKQLNADRVFPRPTEYGGDLNCASYAASALANMLKGFPQDRPGDGTMEYVDKCREWMAQQKKLEFVTAYVPKHREGDDESTCQAIFGMTNILHSIGSLKEWPSNRETPEQWIQDKCGSDRHHLCFLFFKYAQTTNCSSVKRKEIIEFLVRRLNDPSEINRKTVEEDLLTCREADFNDEAKRLIKQKFDSSDCSNVVRLAGLVDIEYCYAKIKPRLKLPVADINDKEGSRISETRWWDMLVAARWGDKEWTKHLIEATESGKKPPDWQILYRLRDLSYVLQPEMVEYLRGYLFSDMAVTVGVGSNRVAWSAARRLEQMIKGFPQYGMDGNFDGYIKTCREWMAQQKKWEFVR